MDNQSSEIQSQNPPQGSDFNPAPPSVPKKSNKILILVIILALILPILAVLGIVAAIIITAINPLHMSKKPQASFDPKLCNENLTLVWGEKTPTRIEKYNFSEDTCDGFRCKINSSISPACYNEKECADACSGQCVNIKETTSACQQFTSPTPTLSASTTDNWETYMSRGNIFSFKYPSDMLTFSTSVKNNPDLLTLNFSKQQETCGNWIQIGNNKVPPNTTIQEALKNGYSIVGGYASNKQPLEYTKTFDVVSVGGIKGLGNNIASGCGAYEVHVLKGNQIYGFFLSNEDVSETGQPRKIFDAILSTFKFTDQSLTPSPTNTQSGSNETIKGDSDNNTTVTILKGSTLKVILNSTYWTFNPVSNSNILKPVGDPVSKSSHAPQNPPGMGTGTVTQEFQGLSSGEAEVSASRTTCGEALRCTGNQGSYTLKVVVK